MMEQVVGVNLIPSIVTSINTAKATANAPSGMSGLLDVLVYVNCKVSVLMERFISVTGQIRGNLNALSARQSRAKWSLARKCVETRGSASLVDEGIVRSSSKGGTNRSIAVILLGRYSLCRVKTALIRGNLSRTIDTAIPSQAGRDFFRACVETIQAALFIGEERVRTSGKLELNVTAVAWIGGQG